MLEPETGIPPFPLPERLPMASQPTLPNRTLGGGPSRRSVNFGGLEIQYDERVLSPRRWTVAQARWMADVLHRLPDGAVLELCSGAGHIGLLTGAYTARDLVLVDASQAACELAELNLAANPVAGSVEIRRGRIDEAIAPEERFVGILADPPWVPSAQTSEFSDDPLTAIDGGEDGLALARVCLQVIDRHLAPHGATILQLGTTAQADHLMDALESDDRAGPSLERVETRAFGDRGVLLHLARRP